MRPECFYILAGETSADLLGARLMSALQRDKKEPIDWIGIGGEQMENQGLKSNLPISKLSVIGILDAFASYSSLLGIAKEQVKQIMLMRPKAVFTVDTKFFSLKLAMLLRKEMDKAGWHVPIIQLVAPTVWAWGKWRAKKFEKAFDQILCLFPFEPSYFDIKKTNAVFVGHPFAFKQTQIEGYKEVDNGQQYQRLIGLFPGSRRGEIISNLPDILRAAELFNKQFPDCQFILPTTSNLEKEVRQKMKSCELEVQIVVGANAFDNCLLKISAAISVSGTATLQLALHAIPAVTCYKTKALNFMLMKLLFKQKDPILPNILLEREVYPCFLQSKQTPEILSSTLIEIYENISLHRNILRKRAKELRHMLIVQGDDFETTLAKTIKVSDPV